MQSQRRRFDPVFMFKALDLRSCIACCAASVVDGLPDLCPSGYCGKPKLCARGAREGRQ